MPTIKTTVDDKTSRDMSKLARKLGVSNSELFRRALGLYRCAVTDCDYSDNSIDVEVVQK